MILHIHFQLDIFERDMHTRQKINFNDIYNPTQRYKIYNTKITNATRINISSKIIAQFCFTDHSCWGFLLFFFLFLLTNFVFLGFNFKLNKTVSFLLLLPLFFFVNTIRLVFLVSFLDAISGPE